MSLFRRRDRLFERVRALGTPDWSRLGDELAEIDERIGAENGWFVAEPGGFDLPCTVFLTNHGIYMDVRSDLLTGSELIKISMYGIERAGAGMTDDRNLRFAVVFATNYGPKGEIKGVAVDFERSHKDFVNTLVMWGERFTRQTALTKAMLEGPPPIDGRPFGTREDTDTEVTAGMAAKQDRLDRIEAVLARLEDRTDPRIQKLEEERHHLRTFFWLARGGDRRGEPFPNPSQDMSVEEIDLLAKLRALDDTL